MTSSLLFLAADAQGSPFGGIALPLMLVMVVFYFIVLRPQSKERKQRAGQLAALKKHDKVITNAGIHGTVVDVHADIVVLKVDDKNNVRMRFSKSSIWQVLSPDDAQKPLPEQVDPSSGGGRGA